MEFKTPIIEDKEEIDRCILADDTRSCDYATANIILWSPFYQVKYAIIDGLFVSNTDEEGLQYFLFISFSKWIIKRKYCNILWMIAKKKRFRLYYMV